MVAVESFQITMLKTVVLFYFNWQSKNGNSLLSGLEDNGRNKEWIGADFV